MNREEIAKSSIMRKNEPVERCSFLIGVLDVSSFVHAYQILELNTKFLNTCMIGAMNLSLSACGFEMFQLQNPL